MPTNPRARLQVEQLESRTLMAQAGLAGGLSFLRPPLPAGLVAAAQADQVIPRPRLLAGRIAVENLLEADGTPDNKSRVVLPFTQPITLADASQITITARLLDPARPRQPETVSIPVLTAAVDPSDPGPWC